ncbi:hypothetical protein BVY03_03335 [bacterium K02(2017)]|nr:hypothetical protein BVY03_03335 [bacterium K02(2017)]
MDLNLKDKKVVVTGSSKGIGLVIAQAFLQEGAQVVINGRDQNSLESALNKMSGKVFSKIADVSKPEEADELIEFALSKMQGIDILVCNVGSGRSVQAGEETHKSFVDSINTNLFSSTNVIEAARDGLSKSNGTIICISSICGQEALGAPATYSAAKAALNSYIKNVTMPFAKKGIRINAVAPGNINFKGSVWEEKLNQNKSGVEEMLKQKVALQRFGKPEEIANTVLFLASDKASFITGEIVVVDGGQVNS